MTGDSAARRSLRIIAAAIVRPARRVQLLHPLLHAEYQDNLGGCLIALGRYAEAEPPLRAAYATLSAQLPPEHVHVRHVRNNLAELYRAWGRPEEAAAYREGEGR